jgi:XTP/dITP diphosphohydrolase
METGLFTGASIVDIILATNNSGKLVEMQSAMATIDPDIQLISYEKFRKISEKPVETGQNYFENAYQKASFYANRLQRPVLGDDGGLELAAFPNLLGVQTQRFFKTRQVLSQNKELLALFKDPATPRTATLTTTLVYVKSATAYLTATASLTGEIVTPRGTGGYGFDFIFYVPAYQKTLAELSKSQRDALSPRLRALAALVEKIKVES